MRSIVLFACASFCLSGIISCRDRSAQAAASSTAAITAPAASSPVSGAVGYSLLIPESYVNWKGRSVASSNGHQGYIKPLTGTLALDGNGNIAGGYFELDMNTITLTDRNDTSRDNGIISHLKDVDFFEVKKYPKASFQLSNAAKAANDSSFNITGQLTLRGVTQEISFPATIVKNGENINATASVTIDRTKWGITYHSGSVFGAIKDDLIEDRIPVSLVLRFHQD